MSSSHIAAKNKADIKKTLVTVFKLPGLSYLFTFIGKLSNRLCGISTTQLEVLLWRAKSNSPNILHLQDPIVLFTQVSNVYKCMIGAATLFWPQGGTTWENPVSPYSMKPYEQTFKGGCCTVLPWDSLSLISNCLVLIPPRQLANYYTG